jgi:hypothetical protein
MYGRDVRNALRDRGVAHQGPSDPMGEDCLVAVVASRPALAVARDLDSRGQPFVPVWGYHGRLQVGPVVAPGGPCFACFEARERQHAADLAVHDAIIGHWLREVVPPPTDALRALTKVAASEIGAIGGAIAAPTIERVPPRMRGIVRRHAGTDDAVLVIGGHVVPMDGCQCGRDVA